ncbi:MAG TPA: HAMP domain-containing sensor histidine kinase, partial [Acidimicrobiales bacterium]|nr:HAMP domain-containing sensor histidine kinase [Acidimicrobiales bacterium]
MAVPSLGTERIADLSARPAPAGAEPVPGLAPPTDAPTRILALMPAGEHGTERDALAAAVLEVLARRRDYALTLVEQRTSELQDSQAHLVESEKLAAVGLMAASVGHELRNPLGVLANCLYLLDQRLTREGILDERLGRQLGTANRELATANLIVSDLVDWSREPPPNPQPVDLSQLVDETLESSPPPKGAAVVWEHPDRSPVARCDREHAKHTLLNLISNAYDALPNDKGTVVLKVAGDNGRVTITVADDGSGMSEDTRSRL